MLLNFNRKDSTYNTFCGGFISLLLILFMLFKTALKTVDMVNGTLNNFSATTVPFNFAGKSTFLKESGYYPFIAVKYFDS